MIDFTLPHATIQHSKIAAETGTGGHWTTGMNDNETAAIAQAGQSTAIIRGEHVLGVRPNATGTKGCGPGQGLISRLLNITTTKRSTRHRGPR